jgi:hypothetical protein
MPQQPNVVTPAPGIGMGMKEGGRHVAFLDLEDPGLLPDYSPLQ